MTIETKSLALQMVTTCAIGALTPISAVLASQILGAATQLKAWMNTTFANSSLNKP